MKPIPMLVEASSLNVMQVVRLNCNSFHVIAKGLAPLVLYASNGILVREPLAQILRTTCAVSAKFIPVVLSNAEPNNSDSTYVECVPTEEVTPENIASIDGTSFKVWHFARESLFFSVPLVNQLKQHEWSAQLSFSSGFSRFAAGG